jgi:hypothetical protein
MDLVIDPQPDAEQREALELALAGLAADHKSARGSRSAWWKAGVAESIDEGALDDELD